MKELIRPKDLTAGRPLTVLLSYSLPMFAGMFFQQAYNLADSWIAGNCIGSISLGAVGTCYPVTVLYIAIASGLGTASGGSGPPPGRLEPPSAACHTGGRTDTGSL